MLELLNPRFEGVNRLFFIIWKWCTPIKSKAIFSSEDRNKRLQCYDWWKKNVFNQPIKNDLITYENTRGIAAGQGDNCATVWDFNKSINFKHQ